MDDGVKTTKQQDYKEALMNAKLQAIERAGVEITSITRVINFQTKFDMVESKAKAVLLPGFKAMDMGYQVDGTYQVVLVGKVGVGDSKKKKGALRLIFEGFVINVGQYAKNFWCSEWDVPESDCGRDGFLERAIYGNTVVVPSPIDVYLKTEDDPAGRMVKRFDYKDLEFEVDTAAIYPYAGHLDFNEEKVKQVIKREVVIPVLVDKKYTLWLYTEKGNFYDPRRGGFRGHLSRLFHFRVTQDSPEKKLTVPFSKFVFVAQCPGMKDRTMAHVGVSEHGWEPDKLREHFRTDFSFKPGVIFFRINEDINPELVF